MPTKAAPPDQVASPKFIHSSCWTIACPEFQFLPFSDEGNWPRFGGVFLFPGAVLGSRCPGAGVPTPGQRAALRPRRAAAARHPRCAISRVRLLTRPAQGAGRGRTYPPPHGSCHSTTLVKDGGRASAALQAARAGPSLTQRVRCLRPCGAARASLFPVISLISKERSSP